MTLTGHTGRVQDVAFSPDGKRILSASLDGKAKIWDSESGALIRDIQGASHFASFSPDGKWIVAALRNRIHVLDAETGQKKLSMDGGAGPIISAAFSQDGMRIVSTGVDPVPRVWDATNGRLIFTLRGHTGNVDSVSFSPDGRKIVSSSMDKTIRFWDVANGDELYQFKGHGTPIMTVRYSTDGKYIISASFDGEVKIWKADFRQETLTMKEPQGIVEHASFSPNGDSVISASRNKTIVVWDSLTGRKKRTLYGHDDFVNFGSFSPDGKWIVSAGRDQVVKVWDTENRDPTNGEELQNARNNSIAIVADAPRRLLPAMEQSQQNSRFGFAVAIDGGLCVVGAPMTDVGGIADCGTAYVFDDSGNLLTTLNNPTPAKDDQFGNSVAIAGETVVVGASQDDTGDNDSGSVYLFDASNGELISTIPNPTPETNDQFGFRVGGSSDLVVSASGLDDSGATDSGTAYTLDAASGAMLAVLNNPAPANSDNFGRSVAISGNQAIVGAPTDDTQNTDGGAAYLFSLEAIRSITGGQATNRPNDRNIHAPSRTW